MPKRADEKSKIAEEHSGSTTDNIFMLYANEQRYLLKSLKRRSKWLIETNFGVFYVT